MADNRRKRGRADRSLISLSEAYELRYWSKKFRVTPVKLRAAVRAVGRSAKKVGAYIKLQKHRARDRMMISLRQAYEVRYWSKKFKVTPARLRAVVKAAGRSSHQVAAYLQGAKNKRTKKRSKTRRKKRT